MPVTTMVSAIKITATHVGLTTSSRGLKGSKVDARQMDLFVENAMSKDVTRWIVDEDVVGLMVGGSGVNTKAVSKPPVNKGCVFRIY